LNQSGRGRVDLRRRDSWTPAHGFLGQRQRLRSIGTVRAASPRRNRLISITAGVYMKSITGLSDPEIDI
jgi:hypothetical protein